MNDLLYVAVIVLDILVIADVLRTFRSGVARALWIVFVLALPLFGAGVWYYVQYVAPKAKRMERERRAKIGN
ncbi:MAG TPA: PLD nuclease N-terminal domain-containing protein [Candidatus Sumerlaeota bacterium]|nr:PLD nuclease N-terminal domain-containing protein [Candidatus Sumerlaeota bacterium]